ncbi:MAG: SUF system NifU family Fe-S cluster assembly protein [Coxiella sp. (in: Bacteria)]|nr:MAG: SUF system NifU family Fe-S cluster assembly protein [Coxiella sp. (in: g-proteobacteria)]
MSEIRELYQQLIIDHGRSPRNFGALEAANHQKDGYNPVCGDELQLYIIESDGVIEDIKFEGHGCAISMASASLMSEALKGKTLTEADTLFACFHQLVTEGGDYTMLKDKLGKLVVLAGVAEYPARVKCATLAWHTMQAAIHDRNETVSTE